MTLPLDPLEPPPLADPHAGIDLPDDGWRPPTLRDKIAQPGRLDINAAEALAYGALNLRCNPALVSLVNPLIIAPCCGRKKVADKLVEIAPGGPLLCDSCRRIAVTKGELRYADIVRAHGGPESALAVADHLATLHARKP